MKRMFAMALIIILMLAITAPATASTPPETWTSPQGIVWRRVAGIDQFIPPGFSAPAEELALLMFGGITTSPDRNSLIISVRSQSLLTSETSSLLGPYESRDQGKTWHRVLPTPALRTHIIGMWWSQGKLHTIVAWSGYWTATPTPTGWQWERIVGWFGALPSEAEKAILDGLGFFWDRSRPDPTYPVSYIGGTTLTLNQAGMKFPIPLPPLPSPPVNIRLAEARVSEGGTRLFVRLDEDAGIITWRKEEVRIWKESVWEVFIPNALIQNPLLLLPVVSVVEPIPTTLTLQIGSRDLIVERKGERRTVVLDAMPEIMAEAGRTFLPIRPVVEALGGQINWFGEDHRVEIQSNGRKIILWIGRNTAVVDGREVPIDANPAVRPYIAPPGRTMLPLRFIAEALGAEVRWISETRTIVITYPAPAPVAG